MSFNITFLRHGKADKTLPDHRLHPLSNEGFAQAHRRRQMLGVSMYELILTSPLLRAKQTAFGIAGATGEGLTYGNHVVLNSLFLEDSDPRIAALNKIYNELGVVALEEYEARMKNDLDSLAEEMKADVWNAIVGLFCGGDGIEDVLVVGHAILIPALCQAFAGRVAPFATDIVRECEGYTFTVTDMKRVDLIRSLK